MSHLILQAPTAPHTASLPLTFISISVRDKDEDKDVLLSRPLWFYLGHVIMLQSPQYIVKDVKYI